ncbi:MAG: SDR family oxidoreductase [Cytophagales bacterium]|nr:SDR family oxidoreductase [Cytophagales bacterium]
MSNRICLITGANSGIGFVTARELSRQGMDVIMVCRNAAKGELARNEIKAVARGKVDLLTADLASQESVVKLAQQVRAAYPRLDVLVNNAGLILQQAEYSPEGFENTFAINHLGTFLLTNLLLDSLRRSDEPRVVTVSSDAHKWGKWDLNDVARPKNYSPLVAYANSKLANILFANELARRNANWGLASNSLHPGAVRTNFGAGVGSGFVAWIFNLARPLFLTAEQGAQTSIYLAGSPEVKGVSGKYFVKKMPKTPSRDAQSETNARQLWEKSVEWTRLEERQRA